MKRCFRIAAAQLVALVVVAWGLARPTPALAQDVESRALFDKGVADMAAGKLDSACPAIAESLRLARRAGTMFTLAECYSKRGNTASAYSHYRDYLDMFGKMTPDEQSKQGDRAQRAQDAVAELGPTVPMLSLQLPDGISPDVEVKRDGVVLGRASLGVAIPVDPGEHLITTQLPGGPASRQTVTIQKGEKKEFTLTVAPPGSAPKPENAGPPLEKPTRAPEEDTSRGAGQRVAGIVVGSLGVAGLIVGGAVGGAALADKSVISANCDTVKKVCHNATGTDAVSSAKTKATVSSVSLAVGGVALATGIVVFATAPRPAKKASARVRLGVGVGTASVGGEF